MNYEEMLTRMKGLKEEKESLLSKLRESLPALVKMRSELARLRAHAKKSSRLPSPEDIKRRIDEIEFQIATSAYTPARERELIKECEKERNLLAESNALYSKFAAFDSKRKEFGAADSAAQEIESKLDALRSQMSLLHVEIVEAGDASRKQKAREYEKQAQKQYRERKRSERSREAEPFLDKGEIEVSLLDAAIMSKEDRKKLREEA
jgi:uncharacterized coiled-coil DUF342 family protein